MFKIGDTIIYSAHGLCEIDDICEKTYSGVTRKYYVLHPLSQSNLTISIPVESDKVLMLKKMEKKEAEAILQSFSEEGIPWVEDVKKRKHVYNHLVNKGDRKEIAKIANTLMRKTQEYNEDKKRMYDQDRKMLHTIQNLLFNEIANTLNISYEEILNQIESMVHKSVDLVGSKK
ncbi:CarD family transcriptional regulator [Niallia sp. Krafla_26]|uniref:CarD family transcriptional regulator n=1 Tax=Niallia sp. Krafla_26 TaxID=3064703 RepID=UPI003D1789B8